MIAATDVHVLVFALAAATTTCPLQLVEMFFLRFLYLCGTHNVRVLLQLRSVIERISEFGVVARGGVHGVEKILM